jgi:hypothetical protein
MCQTIAWCNGECPANYADYSVVSPTVSHSGASQFNLRYGRVGEGAQPQMGMNTYGKTTRPQTLFAQGWTDTGDPFKLSPGSDYWFMVQGCIEAINYWPWGTGCKIWSDWTFPLILYTPDTGTHWYDSDSAGRGPNDGWAAGFEVANGQYRNLEVCAVEFFDGTLQSTQLGQYHDKQCFFPYAGVEQVYLGAMVLDTLDANVGWAWNNTDNFMQNAVAGGWEKGHPLYVCRAWYTDPNNRNNIGYHPGKVIGNSCDISYNGAEIFVGGYWQVLRH